MTRTILLTLALLAAACAAPSKTTTVAQDATERSSGAAAPKRDDGHPLFVGHGTDGEMVMASTHYDSMSGLGVAASELALTGRDEKDLVCKRETVTGTHMPQWICRYKTDVEKDREATQRMLETLPKACAGVCNQ